MDEALEFLKRKIESETRHLSDQDYLEVMEALSVYCDDNAEAKRAEL